ncbi:GtrA family protein [Aerococcaceae bacterium NML191292]|nr:GtrA family protein [Aerococcaceae bacterium NML191292]MCW6681358.1 GtrA family protein [Aerococcaceae bacterium NML160702]
MSLPTQVMRFVVVGGMATAIDFVILWVLYHQLGVHYLIATTIGFVVATVFNYWASMKFVFRGKPNQSKKREFILFVVLSVIGLLLTVLLMQLSVAVMELPVMISRILVTGIVMTFNFVTRKWLLEAKSSLE